MLRERESSLLIVHPPPQVFCCAGWPRKSRKSWLRTHIAISATNCLNAAFPRPLGRFAPHLGWSSLYWFWFCLCLVSRSILRWPKVVRVSSVFSLLRSLMHDSRNWLPIKSLQPPLIFPFFFPTFQHIEFFLSKDITHFITDKDYSHYQRTGDPEGGPSHSYNAQPVTPTTPLTPKTPLSNRHHQHLQQYVNEASPSSPSCGAAAASSLLHPTGPGSVGAGTFGGSESRVRI